MTDKFGRIRCAMDEGHNCCGQMVIFNIEEGGAGAPPWARQGDYPTYSTREEQFKQFSIHIAKHVEEITDDWNMGLDDDEKVDCCYGFMTMTLIKGPKPQIPGLIEYLVNNGWQCDQEVKNPKTKNTIVHLSKAL